MTFVDYSRQPSRRHEQLIICFAILNPLNLPKLVTSVDHLQMIDDNPLEKTQTAEKMSLTLCKTSHAQVVNAGGIQQELSEFY